jgi:transcriptional regulator with XRE-family HTH domain
MSLGERVRERRNNLRITQREVATALGVTPQYISLIEQDDTTPSLSLLIKLAEELGVTTDYLLTGKEFLITDPIPAIKAAAGLSLKAKRLLLELIEEFTEPT